MKEDFNRKLRYGMVGGGIGSFIGKVHRDSISLNRNCELVAGVFSSNYNNNLETGLKEGVERDRIYSTYEIMAKSESEREDCIDFVVIVTPNHLHYKVAKEFLNKGINVVCEKPMTTNLSDAEALKKLSILNDCLFMTTYTYTGHSILKEVREKIRLNQIGNIRMVMAEYASDWLVESIEKEGSKQAEWRTDPERSGRTNCLGDIGSHVENLVSYLTGLTIDKLLCNLDSFGSNRILDDNASVLVKYDNGATGLYWCSQIAIGNENGLRVRIIGEKGTIEFDQENCNYFKFTKKGEPVQILSRGADYISTEGAAFSRLPAGHPEGYFEAYANLYLAFSNALNRKLMGEEISEDEYDYPSVDMGLEGVIFIEKCLESMENNNEWIKYY